MANKIYRNPETAVTWTDTGGDKLLDLGGLATGAVACGAYLDRGAGAVAGECEVEVLIDGFDTAPVVGETVALYFTQSNATTGFDGAPTTDPTASAQGTVTVNQLANLVGPFPLSVVSTAAGDNLRGRFLVPLTGRYVAPVIYNNTADALLGTSDAHKVIVKPYPPEVQ